MQNGSPNRNGGRHRCQPPSAPSLDPPVFASLTVRRPSATRSWLTSSGVASSFWSYPKVGSETFCGPSWVGTSASPAPRGSRELQEATPTLPAPLPVVRLGPRPSSSPSGGDRSFGHLPLLLAVAGLPVRRGLPSRSQIEPASSFRVAQSEKNESKPVDNGDIAHKSEESRRDSTQHGESGRQIAAPTIEASLQVAVSFASPYLPDCARVPHPNG